MTDATEASEIKPWHNKVANFTIETVRSKRNRIYEVLMPKPGFRIVKDAKGIQRLRRR